MLPLVKMKRSQYVPEERKLTEDNFQKLMEAAKDQPQVLALLQTIAFTDARVSEARFFTVESVKGGCDYGCQQGQDAGSCPAQGNQEDAAGSLQKGRDQGRYHLQK